ncbi:ribosomal protein L21 [Capsaspora owczarzaki ATCC 30864]|uniref:Ribosomal protein L21 n=1 Tax=Capsaspora owczarzaki (strain ATCC 30864) TaxID=595528 RepID=A0A0D2VLL6_CAPO3|nr:ribosomal protein L21 [Capsaspora owczarzaki ATCC 30864]KJE91017.1 ribosomal protein L21 [Capsaspora owczarzaki ATCC 30864]|eukprot:XP_004348971.1 ribosomal protein L21 [Capsaspora owczarzaki ATCC 30864]
MGYREGTRHLFARKFRQHGAVHLSTYLKTYRVGDIVDIKGNGAVQRGMPYKYYHGKTGRVFNVTPHAVGVVVNKQVGNRIINKRVNLRIEHVKHSTCRHDFLDRVKVNEAKRLAAKKDGVQVSLKRQPQQPRVGHVVRTKKVSPETLSPLPFDELA